MGACYGSVRQTLNEISETTKGFIWKKIKVSQNIILMDCLKVYDFLTLGWRGDGVIKLSWTF